MLATYSGRFNNMSRIQPHNSLEGRGLLNV